MNPNKKNRISSCFHKQALYIQAKILLVKFYWYECKTWKYKSLQAIDCMRPYFTNVFYGKIIFLIERDHYLGNLSVVENMRLLLF